MIKVSLALALVLAALSSVLLSAESICVKYGSCQFDVSEFECSDTTNSSFVRRVCYDDKKRFVVINLSGSWYPHCEVDALSVLQLLSAPSIGRHYNEHFRSKPGLTRGPFDCRDHQMPSYSR